jgi:hypothetical protein
MATIEEIFDNAVESINNGEVELNKEYLIDLFNKIDTARFHLLLDKPIVSKKKSSKTDNTDTKTYNPVDAETIDDLSKCNMKVLTEFSRENEIKIGGTKKDVVERIWRFLQGEASDDDKSPKARVKKEIPKKENHACCGVNSKGEACGTGATEFKFDKWYCWRHIAFVTEPSTEEPEPKTVPETSSKKTQKKSSKKTEQLEEIDEDDPKTVPETSSKKKKSSKKTEQLEEDI